jgi:hypothetical protein
MKKIPVILGLCLALIALPAMTCAPSQQKVTYNTLASVQLSTQAAYNSYLDLVVQGQVRTNEVPAISQDYTLFMTVWAATVQIASEGTNAPTTAPVAAAAAKVVTDINLAKGTK